MQTDSALGSAPGPGPGWGHSTQKKDPEKFPQCLLFPPNLRSLANTADHLTIIDKHKFFSKNKN